MLVMHSASQSLGGTQRVKRTTTNILSTLINFPPNFFTSSSVTLNNPLNKLKEAKNRVTKEGKEPECWYTMKNCGIRIPYTRGHVNCIPYTGIHGIYVPKCVPKSKTIKIKFIKKNSQNSPI